MSNDNDFTDNDFIAGHLYRSGRVDIPLDTRSDHAAALGRLLGHWAFLEIQLTGIMQCLLVTDGRASIVWQKFVSAKAKIELLQRLNWHGMQDETLRDELDKLLSAAQLLNDMRNKYIHALWTDPGGNTNVLMRISNTLPGNYKNADPQRQPFTPDLIQNDVVKIAKLSQSLAEWQDLFSTKFGAPPGQ